MSCLAPGRVNPTPGTNFMVDFQILGEVIGAEFVRCAPGTARTFLRMFELLKGLSGLSERQCYSAAKRIFPSEFAAYQSAVEAGEIAPLLFGNHAGRFSLRFDDNAQWN